MDPLPTARNHWRKWVLSAGLGALVTAVLMLITQSVAATPAIAALASRCSSAWLTLTCVTNTLHVTVAGESRAVYWQTPVGAAPAGGWPTAMVFQGSFLNPADSWSSTPADPFGDYNETRLIQSLLNNGYAVITPAAHKDGSTYWDTNVSPYADNWAGAPDDQFVRLLFTQIDAGTFGPLKGGKLFVAGFSSGGYMASRMTIAYPSRVAAVAVNSAGYAGCLGLLCTVPSSLPRTHAPTLFLHGAVDPIVPITTMYSYNAALRRSGITTRVSVDLPVGHQWLHAAPVEVLSWFNHYR